MESARKSEIVALSNRMNIRDLAGCSTPNNRTVLPNRLIRSGNLKAVSEKMRKTLLGIPIKNIIDLRSRTEIHETPGIKFAGISSVDIPLLGETIAGGRTSDVIIENTMNASPEQLKTALSKYDELFGEQTTIQSYVLNFQVKCNDDNEFLIVV